jgi:hypothetical protein
MLPDDGERRYSLSEILREELQAVKSGPLLAEDNGGNEVSLDTLFSAHAIRNGSEDERQANEILRLRLLYNAAHRLDLSALCLSGGGIRSGSFALGVIQGLTDKGLLQNFDYLSTVSGGGYIGSWLSAWLQHRGSEEVLEGLRSQRTDSDREPEAIWHLREYSSYLTPKVGLVSADTWAALAIFLRNMLLNWLIIVPVICLPVILVKIVAAGAHTATFEGLQLASKVVAVACVLLVGLSVSYKFHRLYFVRDIQPAALEQRLFLWFSVVPAVIAGACAAWLANVPQNDPVLLLTGLRQADPASTRWLWTVIPITGAIVYFITALGIRLIAARQAVRTVRGSLRESEPRSPDKKAAYNIVKDVLSWAVAGFVCGILVWLGGWLYGRTRNPLWFGEVCPDGAGECTQLTLDQQLLLVVFGMPWVLVAMRFGQMFYIMLRSYSPAGDFEREWLGRAGGWHLIAALAWIVLSTVVLLGTILYEFWPHPNWLGGIGALSGLAVRFLGKSSVTPSTGNATEWRALASNIGLGIAGPIFAAVMLILLSMAFDRVVVGDPFSKSAMLTGLTDAFGRSYGDEWAWTVSVVVVLIAITVLTDYFINVNRFSLHALYRNRLIRAFLGAGRGQDRRPDGFTGFDQNDNFRVQKLWPPEPRVGHAWQPFHLINITLNLASSKRLAWQQRKGMSLAVTPLYCGATELGFRRTVEYGDPDGGISLGTAMAISGAAVSPNMGYHSSPSIAFLLTLFNVRLGWWLGNPGRAGADTYTMDAPRFALAPILSELFGLTHEDNRYVYLSDGGHFENLGLYEMVRRRCKWIVVVDGGHDPDRGFADLGNAVLKAWIDLGVRIRFPHPGLLQAPHKIDPAEVPYFALGTIEYASDDPIGVNGDPPQGRILYIKPAVRGDEWAANLIAYKRAHADFPNQSTANQWFNEPQLEAYRVLGWLTIQRMIDAATRVNAQGAKDFKGLFRQMAMVDPNTLHPRLEAN